MEALALHLSWDNFHSLDRLWRLGRSISLEDKESLEDMVGT